LETPGLGHIHQKPVAATGLNVLGSPIIRRHHGQPTGSGLEQRESEGFRESRVDEQALTAGRPAVHRRNVVTPMLFRVGDRAVEIVMIHQLEHLLEHLALLFGQLARVVPASEHQHKIELLTQSG
jgi:hypothetical protein